MFSHGVRQPVGAPFVEMDGGAVRFTQLVQVCGGFVHWHPKEFAAVGPFPLVAIARVDHAGPCISMRRSGSRQPGGAALLSLYLQCIRLDCAKASRDSSLCTLVGPTVGRKAGFNGDLMVI